MEFTDEDIHEFAQMWLEESGEQIRDDEARLKAGLLMELYWAIVEPLPRDGSAEPEDDPTETVYSELTS